MRKNDEIKWLKSLLEEYPMTIYLEEEIRDHIKEIKG